MANLSGANKIYLKPAVMDYTNIGTAAGTATIESESCWIEGIQVTTRGASKKFVLYDSEGTSLNVIGTITMGTQTFSDPPYIPLGFRTTNALTIVNDADFGGIVVWGK